MGKRTLKELTIGNDFMFGAVMIDEENCKGLLERAIGKEIAKVVVSKEKSIVYHPEYKGVRLDVYAKDANDTHYNVEMQMVKHPALEKRSRYYQSQMDMELLEAGERYEELPDTYVIFVCDFDPFGQKKYRYTFRNHCEETQGAKFADGRCVIYLSTCGENEEEVPKELVTFLKFVKADLETSQQDFCDEYVGRLQKEIRHIKESREMEGRFMVFEQVLRDEHWLGRREERQEILLELLEDIGDVPEDLKKRIQSELHIQVLRDWTRLAVKAESIEDFIQKIQ